MKKGLLITALVLTIVTSVIAGTLAVYTTSIDNIANGSVVAKEFVLVEAGTDTFQQNVKIAPGGSDTWQFAVKNNNGSITSETAMKLDVNIAVTDAAGKAAIKPLKVTIKEGDTVKGTFIGTVGNDGKGTIQFTDDTAFAADTAATKTYTVIVEWPTENTSSQNAIDNANVGASHGTAISVSVTGTQVGV